MQTTLNLDHQAIYKEVRAYLLGLFSCEVVQGWSNNAPMPKPPFITMRILSEQDLATVESDYDLDSDQASKQQSTQVMMQVDFYDCQRSARTFTNLWRDFHASERLTHCQPLYTDEPKNMPITNSENLYESRIVVTAYLQYNPVVIHEQTFIDDMSINLTKGD
jgi:hypothetical protein